MSEVHTGDPSADQVHSADRNKVQDDVVITLNGEDRPVNNLPPIKSRPADSASKAKWVLYAVQLGADKGFVSGLKVGALRDLCTRLGG